jgi:hypothetical protein
MQNYFRFEQEFYQPHRGIAMGSPISGLIAEIFLQYFEDSMIECCLETKSIQFYARYVADILIVFDKSALNSDTLTNTLNDIHNSLTFMPSCETEGKIHYLDLQIICNNSTSEINIFCKPTTTEMTIHVASNHPMEHKTAAYHYLLQCMNSLLLSNTQNKENGKP